MEAVRGDRFEVLYVLAIALGLRRGELLGLKWDDLDLDKATLRVRRVLQRLESGLAQERKQSAGTLFAAPCGRSPLGASSTAT